MVDHVPPRPYSYWRQVCQDAKCWVILVLWSTIAASLILAIWRGWYLLLLPAALLLQRWWFLCRNVVSNFRHTPTAIGIMDAKALTHPLGNVVVGRPLTANAELPDRRMVWVTISKGLVQCIPSSCEKAEVMILDNKHDDFPIAFGLRPIPKLQSSEAKQVQV
jgi:hypothetical protein